MKTLTQAEEQVMQALWKIRKGFVNDILKQFPEPKPAYNTVSTIVRILEKKGFIDHNAYGKTHEYFPLVSRKEYSGRYFKRFFQNYFNNSYQALGSFLASDKDISIEELEEIRKTIDNQIQKQKEQNNG
ncbi:MAG: BlaI/MecI/CopY family transcriptional regulator [Bacteroidales bacterium]|nr:BlaI/MecI/CopY family transcriptional regulator [Bacteroidales bacterium]